MGGREEQYGSISDLIVRWEGMESKEGEERGEEESIGEGRRRKRLSKSIRELSGKFEEGGLTNDSQLGVGCGEGGEGLKVTATFSKISKCSGWKDRNSMHAVDISKSQK